MDVQLLEEVHDERVDLWQQPHEEDEGKTQSEDCGETHTEGHECQRDRVRHTHTHTHRAARSPMTRSLAEASTRELVSATPYSVKRDDTVLRLP